MRDLTAPALGDRAPRPSPPRAALAGAAAAAVALAAAELVTGIAGQRRSLITSVGDEFVDRFAASLKDVAVRLFGTDDKTALLAGIVSVALLAGALLGIAARRSFPTATAGFAGFGLIGLLAGLGDPLAELPVVVGSVVVSVTAGIATLALLLRPSLHTADGPLGDPRTGERRRFLALAGTALVLAAAGGAAGRFLLARGSIAAQRLGITLPRPRSVTAVPAAGAIEVAGVSPYVTPVSDFFRIDTALVTPQVDVETWTLNVDGLVDEPFAVTFDELLTMPLVEEPVTLACVSNEVGGDLIGNARWLGVPLVRLLERAGVKGDATQIVGRSVDGFTVGFPTEVARDGRVALVAVGMNGEPLTAAHGYPARLVVAGLYGYVSATKWLTEIELRRLEDFDAYWVPRGWAKEAPVKTQSRIDVPRSGARIVPGPTSIAGVAWAPTLGIRQVEVQVDDGPWRPARLGTVASDNTWVQWAAEWAATPGDHVVRVRATDGSGTTQTSERADPAPDGATGWHTRNVRVTA